jgi:chaperonin cofactor prefoldin
LKDEFVSHKHHIYKNIINTEREIVTSSDDEKYEEIIQRLKRLMDKQKDVDLRMKQLEAKIKEE